MLSMAQQINYDAEFCGRLPLHQTNSIQPHGVLLVVDKTDHRILQASENAGLVFEMDGRKLVDKRLSQLLGSAAQQNLEALLTSNTSEKFPFLFHLGANQYVSFVHQQRDFYLLEIDGKKRTAGCEESFVSVYQRVKYLMAAMEAAATTEETCRVVARELKQLSGFDKVMIYRFDEAWNGDVIAEAKEEEMESYLGLKFPASDIPQQARELYKKMPYRLIPTIDYEPVKLYPVLNPKTNAFTDLSDSNLRSVAGVHLAYLRNMNVTASMSTRILKDGELWGLIACHHRTPNYLSYEMCSVFELVSGVITTRINAVQNSDLLVYKEGRQQKINQLMQLVYQHNRPASYLALLLTLLEADGVSVVFDGQVSSYGQTPTDTELDELVLWLSMNEAKELYHQPSLSLAFEPAEQYGRPVSGLLALPIEPGERNFILAFRSEAVQKVNWGGNPAEAVQFEADGKKYHPRASFRQWQQIVRHSSLPWRPEALEAAEEVKSIFTGYRLFNR